MRELSYGLLILVLLPSAVASATDSGTTVTPTSVLTRIGDVSVTTDRETTIPFYDQEPLPDLLKHLNDEDNSNRAMAAMELGRRKTYSAADLLRKMLSDPVSFVRLTAAESLEKLGDNSGKQVCKDELASGSYSSFRAAQVLVRMGDPTGLPLVKSKIDSRVQGERMLALIAVKDYPDDELVYHYLKMGLKDPDQSIRTGCIYWLAEQGRPRGVEILKSAYKTFSKSLEKRCALDAVAWTGLWDAMPLLLDGLDDQDSELRQHAAAYLNLLTGETKILKVRDPEDASESSRQWHAWWEQNKSKHPMGTKSDSPALKRGRRYM